jgi:hypothetical protein
MKPIAYGITVEPAEVGHLAATMTQLPDFQFMCSIPDAPSDAVSALLDAEHIWGRLQSAQDICGPLVRSVAPLWPTTKTEAVEFMSNAPQTLAGWTCRNLLFQFATGGFLYSISEITTRTQDLITHLTVAKMFGQTTIGIMPSTLRTTLETPTLTMTDHIVGEADPRALRLVLESLNKDPERGD